MREMSVRSWVAGALSVMTSVVGCGESGRIDIYLCEDPCGNGQPGTTCEDPCGACRGQCVPLPPIDFDGPVLLWTGTELEAPECPARAPALAYEGHAHLDTSQECPPCACSEPSCVPPSGLTASTNVCPGGGTQTAFEAPASWSGACTSPTTVPPDLLASVTIAPVTTSPCEPLPQPAPSWEFYSPWGTFARACRGKVSEGMCRDPGLTCEPTAEPPPPGFRQCLVHVLPSDGADVQCPAGYPEKQVFWGDLDDTRECTKCQCTETAPSSCSAMLSYYEDEACTAPLGSTTIGTGPNPPCADVQMPGAALASMKAEWLVNEPGACAASGGEALGKVEPLDPRTFCCQPSP